MERECLEQLGIFRRVSYHCADCGFVGSQPDRYLLPRRRLWSLSQGMERECLDPLALGRRDSYFSASGGFLLRRPRPTPSCLPGTRTPTSTLAMSPAHDVWRLGPLERAFL